MDRSGQELPLEAKWRSEGVGIAWMCDKLDLHPSFSGTLGQLCAIWMKTLFFAENMGKAPFP